jgi:hypothetical protein
MNYQSQTRFAACFLPLALLLLLQGGSCRNDARSSSSSSNSNTTANNRNGNTGANANTPKTKASPAATKETPMLNQETAAAKSVQVGEWGGRSVGLTVTAGGARVEFDCAHGSINQKMTLDADGRFDVAGTFVRERGGPVRMDEPSDKGSPARYSGKVEGKTMSLTLKLTDTNETIEALTLTHGQSPRLTKCL